MPKSKKSSSNMIMIFNDLYKINQLKELKWLQSRKEKQGGGIGVCL